MVGDKIKEYRKLLQLSQYELGKKVGIDQTLISRIERNTRKVTVNELPVFAKALDKNVSDLLSEK